MRSGLVFLIIGVLVAVLPMRGEGYAPARLLGDPSLSYPADLRARGRSGIVVVEWIVGVDGRPQDVIVVGRFGASGFVNAALRAIDEFRFDPARLDGVPVASAWRQVFTFELVEDASEPDADPILTTGTRSFRTRYARILADIEAGNFARADRRLNGMLARADLDLPAHAHLRLVESLLAERMGDPERRLYALDWALMRDGRWLHGELRYDALSWRLKAQLELQRLGDAFQSVETALRLAPEHTERAAWQRLRERLVELMHGDDTFDVSILVGADRDGHETGFAHYRPLRQAFGLVEIQGDVSTVEIRCATMFGRFEARLERAWRLPDGSRDCVVWIFGGVGSQVRLREYGDAIGVAESSDD